MAKFVVNLQCGICGNTHPHLPVCPWGYFNTGLFPGWVSQEHQAISNRCWRGGEFQSELYRHLINMLILEMEYRAAHGDPQFRQLRDQVVYNYAVDSSGATTTFVNGVTTAFAT